MKWSFLKKLKSVDYRYYILLGVTLILLSLGFLYKNSLIRVVESVKDAGLSFGYYFSVIFGLKKDVHVSLIEPSRINILSSTADNFGAKFKMFFEAFCSRMYLKKYFSKVLDILLFASMYGLLFGVFIVAVFFVFKMFFYTPKINYKKSHGVIVLEKFERKVMLPIKNWLKDFLLFTKEKKFFTNSWFFLALLYSNVITLLLFIVAFVFYFFISFDVKNFNVIGFKFVQDLMILKNAVPSVLWVILGIILFHKIRVRIAYQRLHHMEMKNRGFINSLPVVLMINGTMAKKKTTLITDMALSQISIFRNQALETLVKINMEYRNFPFIVFERWLQDCINDRFIYNLATVEKLIKAKESYYNLMMNNDFKQSYYKKVKAHVNKLLLFGYDPEVDLMSFDSRLQVTDLWEDLMVYGKAYFIYITQNFLLSNYSIRSDDCIKSLGNFPTWDDDFNGVKSTEEKIRSRFAKILNFDLLRLGKKVVEDDRNTGAFEFGVVNISEVGKERLNKPELAGVKKQSEEANQKNDLFNLWLKLSRHSATVDYYPYVKVFCDEQRPESWGADAKDLCLLIGIEKSYEKVLALPFFTLEDWFCEAIFSRFLKFYLKYRFYRSDETLVLRFLKYFGSKLYVYKMRIENRFSYTPLKLSTQAGTQEGDKEMHNYYLLHKKIYSHRFSTDCFKNIFYEKSKKARVGLDSFCSYKSVVADFKELQEQHSYFIDSLGNVLSNDESEVSQ